MEPNEREIGIKDNDFYENEVIPKILECQVIVFVSSVYNFGMNAQLKTAIDRLYNYNSRIQNKNTVVLVTGYGTQKQIAATKLTFEGMEEY